jgi:hypothetical protein
VSSRATVLRLEPGFTSNAIGELGSGNGWESHQPAALTIAAAAERVARTKTTKERTVRDTDREGRRERWQGTDGL